MRVGVTVILMDIRFGAMSDFLVALHHTADSSQNVYDLCPGVSIQ